VWVGRGARGSADRVLRLLAVAALAVIFLTSVHGAGSTAAPAGAVAAAPASLAAAVVPATPGHGWHLSQDAVLTTVPDFRPPQQRGFLVADTSAALSEIGAPPRRGRAPPSAR
jgi:hypothetical protein